ncbi:hypothetical protein [Chitinilyticum piscinae]|uniref:Uncharacterized protein n=1 Tax=Chitinilyticum piscinae TaxID=2866724 RepID=A0A8J7K1R9_9NEIS|nr:hypothetical protein [Chitinilyticum piscinae]MBE9609037.1 hypothetical protein [Chitinilyticum piscinae]
MTPSFQFPGPWQTLLFVLLLLGVPVAAFFINAHFDEPLDSATQQWLDWQLPAVATMDNGYLDLVALEATAPDRLQLAATALARQVEIASLAGGDHAKLYAEAFQPLQIQNQQIKLPEGLCGKDATHCLPALHEHAALLQSLRAANREPLQRYQQMLSRPAYAELLPPDLTVPIPGYAYPMQLSKLNASQIADLAAAGQFDAALALWNKEQQFWLRAAHGSRTLINLMVAAAGLRRGTLLLADLLDTYPQLATTELNATRRVLEESLQLRPLLLQGAMYEFQGVAYIIRHPEVNAPAGKALDPGDKVLLSMIKPHASLNLQQRLQQKQLQQLGIPIPSALANNKAEAESTCDSERPWLSFNNPGGKLLACIAEPDFSSYRDRLATVEKDSQTLLNRLQAQ